MPDDLRQHTDLEVTVLVAFQSDNEAVREALRSLVVVTTLAHSEVIAPAIRRSRMDFARWSGMLRERSDALVAREHAMQARIVAIESRSRFRAAILMLAVAAATFLTLVAHGV